MSMQTFKTNKAGTVGEADRLRKNIDEMLTGMDNEKLDAVCFLLSGMQGGTK